MKTTINQNMVMKQLEAVFKTKTPKTATNFFTANGCAVFEGGRINGLLQIKMTNSQIEKLKNLGLMGSSGWSLK